MTGRPKRGIVKYQDEEQPAGYNERKITFMRQILPPGPPDPHDVDEMERRFERYLDLCIQYDMKVSNQAAYAAIGINKDQVYDWTHPTRNTGNRRRTEFVRKVQQICSLYREEMMMDGRINPVTGIFWQKNYDGFKDQQEVVVTPNNPLGDTRDPEELKQKYLESTYNLVEEKTPPTTVQELLSESVEMVEEP